MILVIDGMNFAHRARSGFQQGGYSVVYNFFRQLRALIEQFDPTRVILTMEGHPKKRLQLLSSYKANRIIDVSTEEGAKKHASKQDFHRQADIALELLQLFFPVSVMRHPDHEADDLIYTIVCNGATSTDYTIVSTDTDFIQVIQKHGNVRLYNPVTKSYVSAPDAYDYLHWKALRGDPSDNVPSLPGVNDNDARNLLDEPDRLRKFFSQGDNAKLFERNCALIKLHHITGDDALQVLSSTPIRDWDTVKQQFDAWGFKSITKPGTWEKFVQTFDVLFG